MNLVNLVNLHGPYTYAVHSELDQLIVGLIAVPILAILAVAFVMLFERRGRWWK